MQQQSVCESTKCSIKLFQSKSQPVIKGVILKRFLKGCFPNKLESDQSGLQKAVKLSYFRLG